MGEIKKKFVLEFDEEPALVFVSHGTKNCESLYINGEKVEGWRGITIDASMDEPTTYQLEAYAIKRRG